MSQEPELSKQLKNINSAMEDADTRPAPSVPDEREAFESCALMEGSLFKRRADEPDKYWDGNVQDDWELWQARAILALRHQAAVQMTCHCHTCRPITMDDMRMVLCPKCGNKRCPHANDHRNDCTGSNEPGQPGSAYPAHHGITAQPKGVE